MPQLLQLVGNPTAYAVQLPSGKYKDVREPLTPAVLKRHVTEQQTIGTYVVYGDKARTLVFDIDEDNWSDVDSLLCGLGELGIPERSIAVEFSGKKGYHIWVVLSAYVLASDLRRVGRAALALSGVQCEVFPKQDKAVDLGNLIKLPGGVHQVSGNHNNFLGAAPQPMGVAVFNRTLEALPAEAVRAPGEAPPATECLDNIMAGVEEGGRNEALFHLAALLRYRGIPDSWVVAMVNAAAQASDPPLDQWEVDRLLESSMNSGPKCSSLPDHLRCTECPVLRDKGLFCRENQLRFGAEGELVVVRLGKRRAGGVVELEHPDLAKGLLSLR